MVNGGCKSGLSLESGTTNVFLPLFCLLRQLCHFGLLEACRSTAFAVKSPYQHDEFTPKAPLPQYFNQLSGAASYKFFKFFG